MDIDELAKRLYEAERRGVPIVPLSADGVQIDGETAYLVQRRVGELKAAQGRKRIGRKTGVMSKAQRAAFNIHEPDYGTIFDDNLLPEEAELSHSAFRHPRVEPEIAFLMKSDLAGPGVTGAAVLGATEGVTAALELVDSRYEPWAKSVEEAIADNASLARVVVGGQLCDPRGVDLRLVGMVMRLNGEIVGTAAGAAVYGNPADAVAWLVNKLSEHGEMLRAGEVVMSGSLIASVSLGRGSVVSCTIAGMGSVACALR